MRGEAARLKELEAELESLEATLKAKAEEVLRLRLRLRGEERGPVEERLQSARALVPSVQ